jgi:hypothetical protein
MLEAGEYASSTDLAKAEKVNDFYVSRILRLTLIAPDIIEAILCGSQPARFSLMIYSSRCPRHGLGSIPTCLIRGRRVGRIQ